MLTLPDEYNTLFAQLRPFFSKRVWKLGMVLLIGAILAPGKRTVTAALRIMGLSQERHFPWPIRPGQAELPSCSEPCRLVQSETQSGLGAFPAQYVSAHGPGGGRDR